ncbi:MAG: hypothetical protein FWE35_11495 [Streptosporangiales bacterium]|nr:hypothetical protein [Streptosporangiales bacterium]
MIAQDSRLTHFVGSGSQVGVQGQGITITGGVHVGGPGDPPQVKFAAGVANLERRNPGQARKLLWEAMTGGYKGNKVLFYWLVAMLSGRTARQFSKEEIGQLRRSRDQFAKTETEGDEWAAGARLIYALLDSALRDPATETRPKTRRSLLDEQFDELGKEQRELLEPLDLFLSGPRRERQWQAELREAQSRQHSGDRGDHAWKFFHPDPAKVVLPPARRPVVMPADCQWVWGTVTMFAVLAGSCGLWLLWVGAFFGLIGYTIALLGAVIAIAGNMEARFAADRRRLVDEQFGASIRPDSRPSADDELTREVNKLFKKYINRCEEDKSERERWKNAVDDARKTRTGELLGICRSSGILSADEVAWFVRYEIRQLHQVWRDGTLHRRRLRRLMRPDAGETCRAGLAVLVLGGAAGRL